MGLASAEGSQRKHDPSEATNASGDNSLITHHRFSLISTGLPVIGLVALGILHFYTSRKRGKHIDRLRKELDLMKKKRQSLKADFEKLRGENHSLLIRYQQIMDKDQDLQSALKQNSEEDTRSLFSSHHDDDAESMSKVSSSIATSKVSVKISDEKRSIIRLTKKLMYETAKYNNLAEKISNN